jgi:hypothetical protein
LDDAELRAMAARLGREAAERVDVEAVAAAVLRRLRQPPARRCTRWPAGAWRVAAVLALVAGAGLLLRESPREPPLGAALAATVELADLPAADLERLLDSLDDVLRPVPEPQGNGNLDDLTVDQLTAVLRSLEG